MKKLAIILTLLAYAGHAFINVSPVYIEFSNKQNAIEVFLDNQDTKERVFNASIKQWKQENGEDIYSDTTEVLVLPAMRRVAPGSQQKFRVIVPKKTDGSTQKSFRLFFREVPHSRKNITPKSALSIAFQFVVPVFVNEKNYTPMPDIKWTAQHDAHNKKILLKLENKGNTFFKFSQLRAKELTKSINSAWRYVLPNSEVNWKIKSPQDIGMLSLKFVELIAQKPIDKTDIVELAKPANSPSIKKK